MTKSRFSFDAGDDPTREVVIDSADMDPQRAHDGAVMAAVGMGLDPDQARAIGMIAFCVAELKGAVDSARDLGVQITFVLVVEGVA